MLDSLDRPFEGVTVAWKYDIWHSLTRQAITTLGVEVPMIELGWDAPRFGDDQLSVYQQLWIRLSRLGHVAASLGAELPTTGAEPRQAQLIAFVLWDFGDAPLLRGW